MATIEQLSSALVKADAAGNAEDARAFANEIRRMRSETQPTPKEPQTRMQKLGDEALASIPGGVFRGVRDVVDTGAKYAARYLGGDEQAVEAGNAIGQAQFDRAQENVGVGGSNVARVGGQILATLPVGGVLGAGARAVGAARLGTALSTGGMTTGARVAPGFSAGAADLGVRAAGGALTGGAAAGLIDPGSAGFGAAIGGTLPPAMRMVGAGSGALGAAVRPFFASGQDRIAGNTLRDFASRPDNALAQLLRTTEIVPGSAPTTAMAAGDSGLAALSRAMQSSDTRYASELALRQTAQNQARTTALESVAGNTGKMDIARAARDAATKPMRETVLDAAGKVPSNSILTSMDRLIAKPDNAGRLSQQALNDFRSRIDQFTVDGAIDARALYAIRKDINDVLSGKLQGEAGNLRYASGQLTGVKSIIDDAIDQASRRVNVTPTGTAVMPYGSNVSANTIPAAATGPRSTWSDYLQSYSEKSIPINQMERLEKVLRAVQTGSVDSQGGLVLSGAKLNNILKNESADLIKTLSADQVDILRRVSADLNASQIAANTGRAVGSNTLQNLSQNQLLTGLMGNRLGGSSPVTSTLGRVMQIPYGTANKQIQERLGNALLDPQEAARLMQTPEGNRLLQILSGRPRELVYRSAPALSAQ